MMQISKSFFKTVKEAPKEAAMNSHKLLHRGGFIRQVASGRYSVLPLGYRVYSKVVKVIEEEMDAIGSQRMELPIMQPIDVWQVTNRDKAWSSEMIMTEDHYDNKYVLNATGEALITELVKSMSPSYKDLPINFYQFLAKFRDELRPRGGMIRAREFLMKDAYNFEATEEDFMGTYKKYWKAYEKIFERCGLNAVAVEADSGALGGDYSHEFMVECDSGGDEVVVCDSCDYRANAEKAEFEREGVNEDEEMKKMEVVDQPEWVLTIKDNVKHYQKPVQSYLKNVVYKDEDDRVIIAVLRGDQEANEVKIANLVGASSLEKADEKDLERIGSKHGWVHSWGHDEGRDFVVYVVDESLKNSRNLIGGQKEKTTDTMNVNYGRDFKHELEGDIALAYSGAKCKRCDNGKLKIKKAIEVGHIFKYDHYYSEPHKAYFVDKDGKEKPMWMGAYGIGVGRLMSTAAELHNDKDGLIWPVAIAPYLVHIVSLGDSEKVKSEAEKLYGTLQEKFGDEVLWDDRDDASAGEKFADADLIGVPVRIVVSEKTLAKGVVEVKMRAGDKAKLVEMGEAEFEIGSQIN